MNTQPQPKFKFGDKVKTKTREFVIGSIDWGPSDKQFWYAKEYSDGFDREQDLTLVKEPLKAEFECEISNGTAWNVTLTNTLNQFSGKRVKGKFIFEEIL